ncbi:MAG: sulfite exporter TauE/SafE family protein [Deltaproteobacteria bacterium]|nr:sulfite exporter TauE/SafE family protein [Deltaproteobacteria bacterium]MDZ4343123.1 sulfite exporter TauE/SafE family protein [Candidatus Binatia bacterium]
MNEVLLTLAVAAAAALYSSVGHGGASAYIALLTLVGKLRPEVAATILLMNILVSSQAWLRFRQRGYFDAPLAGTLLLFSAPAAFVGGMIATSAHVFTFLVGCALLLAALRLILPDPRAHEPQRPKGAALWTTSAIIGVALGLLAGLTGVGGGIYLSPLLILIGWKDAKGTAGISAAFIAVNSFTGLLGRFVRGDGIDPSLLPLVVAALIGGFIGSWWGAKHATPLMIRRLLGVVLAIAGMKLLFP